MGGERGLRDLEGDSEGGGGIMRGPREDTRCALRELTRESRVPATKHGTPTNETGEGGAQQAERIDRRKTSRRTILIFHHFRSSAE